MKWKHLLIVSVLVFVLFACSDGNDYRDAYVGDYYGDGYSGVIVVVGTGASEEIGPKSGIITVGKDKSSVHMLNITIDDETFAAHIDGSSLTIDPVEYDWTEDSPNYEYTVYKSANGSITPNAINLSFQYSGTAKYTPDGGGVPTYYQIEGNGMCSGTR